jgi:N-acetylglucosamine kinase-like BadF-type ATPase
MARERAYYLGVDGGQSHTTALVATASGRIVGRGYAGPSNHTLEPGGPERLARAVTISVGEALESAELLPPNRDVRRFVFAGAHLAMTGEPLDKLRIVKRLIAARRLRVAHDAPAGLAGATAASDGIVILAGTGSVAFGKRGSRSVRIGGRGYLFADRGSAFVVARQAVSRALFLEERGRPPKELRSALLEFFERRSLVDIIEDFYRGGITRDRLASFARRLQALAAGRDETSREILCAAAADLAEMVEAAAARLAYRERFPVAPMGGMFRGSVLRRHFTAQLAKRLPVAGIVAPQFGSDVGALLLAFQEDGVPITSARLAAIRATCGK